MFNGEAFEVFYVRGESINLSPIIIIRWILYILREKTMLFSHVMPFIEHVEPSIIITFIDNSFVFQYLDANNTNDRIKFIALQNGSRSFRGTEKEVSMVHPKNIYHSNFFLLWGI